MSEHQYDPPVPPVQDWRPNDTPCPFCLATNPCEHLMQPNRLQARRIYFVGAHSTGKTTLARWVAKRYNLPMITEVARGVLAELETTFDELRVDVEAAGDYQREVFYRQVASETRQASQGTQGFVSDRAFDNLAYAAEHTHNLKRIMQTHNPLGNAAEYAAWVGQGVVFFVRPHRSLLKEDGVRVGVDWESVLRIDGMVKFMLEMWGISYHIIETANQAERQRQIAAVLDGRGER